MPTAVDRLDRVSYQRWSRSHGLACDSDIPQSSVPRLDSLILPSSCSSSTKEAPHCGWWLSFVGKCMTKSMLFLLLQKPYHFHSEFFWTFLIRGESFPTKNMSWICVNWCIYMKNPQRKILKRKEGIKCRLDKKFFWKTSLQKVVFFWALLGKGGWLPVPEYFCPFFFTKS